MSLITKHTWKGLTVVAAMLLSIGLVTQNASAAITTSTPANTNVSLTTAATGGSGVYTTVTTGVLSNSAAADFAAARTITLTPPAGWEFNPVAPTVTPAAGTLSFNAPTLLSTVITLNTNAVSNAAGTVTIAGLQIRPLTTAAASGTIAIGGTVPALPASLGTITAVAGFTSGNVAGPKMVLTTTIGDPANIRADGTTAITITATTFNDADNNNVLGAGECTAAYQGIIVQWTTSRGTLSSSSSTTTATSSQASVGCLATIPFRGNGTTGTANVTAVVTQPSPLVATANYAIVAGTITPTEIKFRDTTNSGHVAANQDTLYVTTNNVAQVRFRVNNSSDQGSNGQVVQATVDKGNITPWTDANANGIIDAGEVPTTCPDNVTTTFTTQQNKIDGTDVEGVSVFFVCAKAGQAAGPIKVTAKNLTTTMSDATTTVTSSGIPNKIETVVAGNTVTVTVKDKDGNNVAENTPVTFQVPSFTGTVAPACALTSAGKASASAAFSGTGGQVLITVFYNSSGAAAACPGGGNTVGASTSVNVGSGAGTTPGAGGGGFTGSAPAKGSIGLLVTNQASSAAGLVSALQAAGCTVESLAVLESGAWKIYINGAPTVVNSAFPATVATTVAFFVRCAA